jgi:acetylornithine deacetylase/succinyl-diaminopimelate desuccinylase-like protein
MTETEKLLRELIALPSVNPAFSQDDQRTGEWRVAEYLEKLGTRAGLEVERRKVLPNRFNLLARLAPAAKVRRRILLAPHLDTVNADDACFIPRKRNGRIYGRGASDTKGSIAPMLSALMEVARSSDRPRETEIIFVGLVDEECAQAGSRTLAASGMKADLAIVGEPTGLKVVTAHKGDVWLELETRGLAAHSSKPHTGRNAIHAMAHVVDALETDYAMRLRRRRHPLLGHATVNVGTIHGGKQPNIVPDSCTISLDRRTLPGETETGVRREISAFLRQRKLDVRIDSSQRIGICLPLETDPNLPLVQQFLRSAGQRAPAGVHFFCDAAVLAEGGIPSVVFGPGDIAQGHTTDEFISLAAVERAKRMLVRFFRSLP